MTDIKPCPFCGEDFIEVHVNRLSPSSYIKCSECTCQISISHAHCNDTPSGAIIDALVERWNKRAYKEEKE